MSNESAPSICSYHLRQILKPIQKSFSHPSSKSIQIPSHDFGINGLDLMGSLQLGFQKIQKYTNINAVPPCDYTKP